MLKIEKFVTMSPEQYEMVIEGMRNPKNSWDRSDSGICKGGDNGIGCKNCFDFNCDHTYDNYFHLGNNDHNLMQQLADGGPVHAKYRRMMPVWLTVTAPLYWWKEFDTYKVGTVANSCSTLHKIAQKKFTVDDFSYEHLFDEDSLPSYEERVDIGHCEPLAAIDVNGQWCYYTPKTFIEMMCHVLNHFRDLYLKTNDKKYWWQMIQLLPASYNQKRTVMLNYEVLVGIYKWRRNHKLDEWHIFCNWIEELPYSELITGYKEQEENE